MNRMASVVALLVLISFVAAVEDASAFRCGNRLANIGDTKGEVLRSCGEPTWRDVWGEDRIERVVGYPYAVGSYYVGTRIPIYTVVHVIVEEWTYNLGPNQFMRILRFENNRLVDIQTGDYGYY